MVLRVSERCGSTRGSRMMPPSIAISRADFGMGSLTPLVLSNLVSDIFVLIIIMVAFRSSIEISDGVQ